MVSRFDMLSINLYGVWIRVTYSPSTGALALLRKSLLLGVWAGIPQLFQSLGKDESLLAYFIPCSVVACQDSWGSWLSHWSVAAWSESWLLNLITLQGKKAGWIQRLDLLGSSGGAAGCDGQHLSVMVGQVSIFKSGSVSAYTLWSKLGWVILFSETWPCCRFEWKPNPNDCGCSSRF